MLEKSKGQIAFEAYNEAKGGVTYDGKPIPPWGDVGPEVRAAWEAAAMAVTMVQRRAFPPEAIALAKAEVSETVSGGREKAMVLTKLDEAELWLSRCAWDKSHQG